ncbi:PKD domain-containing protein [Aquimarina sp. D1M17]|uniref:Ig-like domain-containing protein n=1 Tax=Aquimarina acroporae TaxID=2937283 RepID=UPI0020BF54DB|nr:PKD domain-containing protein [Aquimarina acroporae]MCK8524143.1 PKD domain-containing protein [Aquimarina acroporae]
MIQKFLKYILFASILINGAISYGQSDTKILISENQQDLINNLLVQKSGQPTTIELSKNSFLHLQLNIKEEQESSLVLVGNVNDEKASTFSLVSEQGKVSGDIWLQNTKTAYKIFTETTGKVYIEEVSINDVLCVDYEQLPSSKNNTSKIQNKMNLQLESLPGAAGVIYLDFDGEVVTGTRWAGGATIDAQPVNFSDQDITRIWKLMAEDFRPFNLNVTTRRDLFDATPRNRRMMCIFTPTTDAQPGSGGVAYLRSFASNSFDDPCWVYNIRSVRAAGETGSHEVGHTLGLSHDSQGSTEYYAGHGTWSPIMGWSVNRAIGQWSQGEFENANQTQDDIAIMADSRNGVGFRNDDHGDIINNATEIRVSDDGEVSSDENFGFIGTRDDKDVFSFVIEAGDVSFDFSPDPDYPNLNIQARILDPLGEEVAISDPSGLSASINVNLPDGTYFIEIDGVGEGNPITGYSDYASLGNYFIAGNYKPGDNNQPPVANFEAIKNGCSQVDFTSTSINRVNSYAWDFGDGTTSTEQNPTHNYESGGTFTVSLTAVNNTGENTNIKTDFITINIPDQPTGNDQNICPGNIATLTISGNSEFRWYEQAEGGQAIATGTTFETPELDASKSYFISGFIEDCITSTRTEVKIVVVPIPEQQDIIVNTAQRLSVSSEFAEYQWYLDGETLEDGVQAEYLPQAIGEYTVEVFNEAGCSSISEIFTVDRSQLNLSLESRSFTYYPNPVKGEQLLNIDGITINDYDLKIVDILGQTVFQSNPTSELNVSELSQGLYIILINNKSIGKFVKQ